MESKVDKEIARIKEKIRELMNKQGATVLNSRRIERLIGRKEGVEDGAKLQKQQDLKVVESLINNIITKKSERNLRGDKRVCCMMTLKTLLSKIKEEKDG